MQKNIRQGFSLKQQQKAGPGPSIKSPHLPLLYSSDMCLTRNGENSLTSPRTRIPWCQCWLVPSFCPEGGRAHRCWPSLELEPPATGLLEHGKLRWVQRSWLLGGGTEAGSCLDGAVGYGKRLQGAGGAGGCCCCSVPSQWAVSRQWDAYRKLGTSRLGGKSPRAACTPLIAW